MNKTRISQLTAALVVLVAPSCQELLTNPAAPNWFAAKGTVIGTIVLK
jgi:hypothetical protein